MAATGIRSDFPLVRALAAGLAGYRLRRRAHRAELLRARTSDRIGVPVPEDRRRTVQEVYEEERGRLLALPANPFPTDTRLEVTVGKTPYVRFDRNDYSVPHTLVRRMSTVLASPTVVRVLDGSTEVARRVRSYDAGAQIENPEHARALVEMKRHAREHRGMDRLAHAAPSSRVLLERLAERGKNLGHNTVQLTRLLDTYGAVALEAAVKEVLERDVPHVHAVRQVLERNRSALGQPPATPLPLPPGARDVVVRPHALEGYDALAHAEEPEEDDDDDQATACVRCPPTKVASP